MDVGFIGSPHASRALVVECGAAMLVMRGCAGAAVVALLLAIVPLCSSVGEREPPTEGANTRTHLNTHTHTHHPHTHAVSRSCQRGLVFHHRLTSSHPPVFSGFKHVTCGSTIKLQFDGIAGGQFRLQSHEVA